MSDLNATAPVAEKPETPVAQTATVPSPEQTTPPQADKPAGQETEQKAATETPLDKELTQGEINRRERNKERWRQMKQGADDARRRAEAAESELYRIKTAKAPDYSQITDPQEELAVRTAHKVRESMAGDHEARAAQERAEVQRSLGEAWVAATEEARERIPDFDTVVTSQTPIHQRAAPFIVESEKGADIAYYLGKNPDVARSLYTKFDTAPAQALIELGRIEARLSAPTPKTISTAPKPAPTLGGGVNPLQFDATRASADDVAGYLRKAGIIR